MKTALYMALNFGFYIPYTKGARVCMSMCLCVLHHSSSYFVCVFSLAHQKNVCSYQQLVHLLKLFCFSHRIIYNSIFVIQCSDVPLPMEIIECVNDE